MKRQLSQVLCGLVLLAGAAGLGGCASKTVNTVERAEPSGQAQMVSDKRILTDAGLNRRARIVSVNDGMTPGGLLKVQVQILNTTSSLQRINYRFEWFDQNGMQVTSPASAALSQTQIEGRESQFISSLAPTAACRDFRLKLMEAK
jgi:uncharacterized protein YcfL